MALHVRRRWWVAVSGEPDVDGSPQVSRRTFGLGVAGAALGAVGVTTVVLRGEDIDPEGRDDATAGIQARIDDAPDGAVIAIPAGAVLRCTRTVTLHGTGKSLVGPGELRFTEGVAAGVALLVTGLGSRVSQVSVTNPEELFETTGEGRSSGIEIAADGVTVQDCVVDRFGYGIVVAADGEWVDTSIVGNRVTNVLGAGGGRGSDSDAGEDRGDGITVWGARATVTGNVVSAKPGTDARIGIHAEALGDIRTESKPHSDAMVTISGNVVTGPFRRSIVFEEISNGVITGNTVADATWWSIAVIEGVGCLVADNAVRHTRTGEDDQGSSYSPVRCALLVYGGAGHTISGNTITVSGRADAFIAQYTLEGASPTDVLVTGNNCRTVGEGACATGITMLGDPGPVRPKIVDNTLTGFVDEGVYLGAASAPHVAGNTLVGGPGAERGVIGDDPANDGAMVTNNRVTGCGTGIALFNQAAAVVSANLLDECGAGLDLFDSTGVVAVGNVYRSTPTAVANAGSNRLLP